jgi:hypothetical protein
METDSHSRRDESASQEHDASHAYRGRPPDPAALFGMLDGMRRMAPRELEDQVTHLIREFLLTLRALIDWYLERLDRQPQEARVEDIPID